MEAPQFTEKQLKSLNMEEWRVENDRVADEFGISAKIVNKYISLEIIEALLHDALQYKQLYMEINNASETTSSKC
jgi:hypothetical protein